jgi:acetaldehyde dehydrogenase (acetylating)
LDKEARAQLAAQGAFFLNAAQADALAKLVVGPNRQLNPKIVGKPATTLAEWAGLSVPPNTRCLIAEAGGVGRDYPLSIEKLSPILAYYVANGLEEGSRRCDEILHFGGMGHTAAIHTRSREAALHYGTLMPAARVVVNTPATHGAIGFSTALAPSMTLGCGSWGGNVTSDNISPLHLMDIKRVAFETRPVTAANEASVNSSVIAAPAILRNSAPALPDRATIEALVDRVLAARKPAEANSTAAPNPKPGGGAQPATPVPPPPAEKPKAKAVDFVCEEDVKQALAKGEKIYVNAKTIITPAARDLGVEREVFAKTFS